MKHALVGRALKVGLAVAALSTQPAGLRVLGNETEQVSRLFTAIPGRNVFGLTPPEQPPAATVQPPPLRKVLLTGITTILGDRRALLKTLPPPGSPGEKEQWWILAEGQRAGPLEVLQIDENAGAVKVNNSGTLVTLTFEKDGPKLPATPPVGTAPAATPASPGPANGPPAAPAGFGAPSGAGASPGSAPRGYPGLTRPPRLMQPGVAPGAAPMPSLPPLPGETQPQTQEPAADTVQADPATVARSSAGAP